ncbi:MAG TPA: 4-hydroxybenzoate octaprenyltransferase [Microvirga sp.]|jgi:4-hydroxybenzoate polyprenyltransferase
MTDTALPDAVRGHWADRLAPAALRPYLRLARIERPIGWWLLLLPCWWSTALAAMARPAVPELWHGLLFLIGAVAMRGAGSTYNDLVDRDLDAKVERTRDRPLPSGRVTPRAALAFLIAQCLVGLAVLVQFNGFAVATGFASVAIVLLYPFMKRVFWLPQIVLGLAFAWGGLMGWAAAFGSLSLAPVLLYAGAVAWVVGYDTIYALQDLEDDVMAGIKSSALFFGARVREAVGLCYALAAVLVGAAIVAVQPGPFAVLGWAGFALHLAWQVRRLDRTDGALALRLFRSNRDAGLILTAGLAAEAMYRALV